MLKLKYLFDNKDLAQMIVSNWIPKGHPYSLLKQFRISANAVYPFKLNDDVYFLRFSPVEEKDEKQIRAELEYLNYLHNHHYRVVEPIKSNKGNELEIINTPWGLKQFK